MANNPRHPQRKLIRYAPSMRMILAILILLVSSHPLAAQPAQNPLTFVQAGKWRKPGGSGG